MRLLLISNSTLHGQGYLDHCMPELRAFLGGSVRRILFVPFAVADRDDYARRFRERLAVEGIETDALHDSPDARAAVEAAQCVFVGGGNTFRLLNELYERGLVEPIRRRVREGLPYVGSSAGSNVACRTIQTTNDMPIVEPPSFEALALVPFNLNPHYLDPSPGSTHMGETREQRIREFHEVERAPVVGLREGALLRIEDGRMELKGSTGARLFRRGEPAVELAPGARLDYLLEPAS